jgi:hypothetical protein
VHVFSAVGQSIALAQTPADALRGRLNPASARRLKNLIWRTISSRSGLQTVSMAENNFALAREMLR